MRAERKAKSPAADPFEAIVAAFPEATVGHFATLLLRARGYTTQAQALDNAIAAAFEASKGH